MMSLSRVLPGDLLPPWLLSSPVWTSRARALDERSYPPVLLPQPGRCPDHPTLTICLCDNSGSVTGGNDPIRNRFIEMKLAIDKVGGRCRCHRELVAILHFDRGTGGDAGPVALDRRGREELDRALGVPANGFGISELGPSLADALELAQAYPDHKATVIAFTDFEVFDANVQRVLEEFCAFPGWAHAAVLRAEPPTRLTTDALVTVTRILPGAEPGAVARAAFDALTVERRAPTSGQTTHGRRKT